MQGQALVRRYSGRVTDEGGQVFVTPGDVASLLEVSDSSLRRMAGEYEQVFPPLPRDANNRRLWTVEAAQTLKAAHLAQKEGRAVSLRAALEALHEGRELPALGDLGEAITTPDASQTGEELAELREAITRQGEGITTMLQALDERDAEIAGALRALAESQQAQARAVADLSTRIEQAERRAEERAREARAALPPPTPAPVVPRGFLARLLWLLGGR